MINIRGGNDDCFGLEWKVCSQKCYNEISYKKELSMNGLNCHHEFNKKYQDLVCKKCGYMFSPIESIESI
jgi:predicted nucleic-acid-binding Zn-ribbon protein